MKLFYIVNTHVSLIVYQFIINENGCRKPVKTNNIALLFRQRGGNETHSTLKTVAAATRYATVVQEATERTVGYTFSR